MNKFKSLFLGSAAALVAVTGVQAADMPMAPAREPVYRCDITGFYEIPGTDICFKVGGFVRLKVAGGEDGPFWEGDLDNDDVAWQSDAQFTFDARTQTEYGILRAYMEFRASDSNGSTGGPANLRHAYIQFGNWLFGKTWSNAATAYAIPTMNAFPTNLGDGTFRTDQIRYTFNAGNGITIAVSVEDEDSVIPDITPGAVAGAALTTTSSSFVNTDESAAPMGTISVNYAGEIVSIALAAAVTEYDYNGTPLTLTQLASPNTSGTAWAVNGTIGFDLMDSLSVSVGAGYMDDLYHAGWGGYSATPNPLNTNDIWYVAGGVTFDATDMLRIAVGGGYSERDITGTANDDELWEVFGGFTYTPVARLTFGAEVRYKDRDVKNTAVGDADGIMVGGYVITTF